MIKGTYTISLKDTLPKYKEVEVLWLRERHVVEFKCFANELDVSNELSNWDTQRIRQYTERISLDTIFEMVDKLKETNEALTFQLRQSLIS
jgi:cystathionine beta-lyase family protein involved in aluminum resistance